jgi:hypothetical protein
MDWLLPTFTVVAIMVLLAFILTRKKDTGTDAGEADVGGGRDYADITNDPHVRPE